MVHHASTPAVLEPLPRGLSAIVPVYNSADSLGALFERLEPALASLGREFEVILVNDGSRDRSWEAIRGLSAERPYVRAFDMARNYGQHNALLCGIRAARFDTIVTLDDDLQNPPEEIATLLARLDEPGATADVVYGKPRQERHGLLRDLASQLTKWALQSAMGAETARNVSAFRVFRTRLRDSFASFSGPYVSIDVLLTWGSQRFAAVKVRHDERAVGASTYTFRKLFTHAMNMMTGFSTAPLRLASLVGFVFTLFGMGVLAYVLLGWILRGSVVQGFAFLASVIAIFSGAQLFAIGVLGEYLARMHVRLMDRVPYTVREAVVGDGPAPAVPAGAGRDPGRVVVRPATVGGGGGRE
jgi:glycosyltransferase involved in cell wall biosynthesis